MSTLSRRKWLKNSMRVTGGAVPLSRMLGLARPDAQAGKSPKLTIVVAGGHPDDPESGCGGTMARYADAGNKVISLYLTRGEAGIPGKSHDEAAAIRTREATSLQNPEGAAGLR